MDSSHKVIDTLSKIAAMDPDSCGLIDAIHLAKEALTSGSPATGNSVQVDQRVDHLDVLLSVDEQFDRFGDRLPDGFDSRVFRYVKDAIAGAKAAEIAHGAIKQEALVGVVIRGS